MSGVFIILFFFMVNPGVFLNNRVGIYYTTLVASLVTTLHCAVVCL